MTRSAPVVVAAVAAAVIGYGVRLAVLLGSGGLLGSSAYDDGVYYAASAAFVHGRWPYADFLLLHPPAIVVAGAPFAALGAVAGDPAGVVAARLVWIGMGAASCALIAVLAGRRSLPAAVIAGGFAACFFPLAYGERSLLLEPLATLLLLLSLLVEERGTRASAVVAGVLAGVTVDVKAWYVVPAVVLIVFARHRLRFLLGAVAGAAVVAAPFLLRAPGAMLRQVVLDQLGRPEAPGVTVWDRLVAITGARYTGGAVDPPPSVSIPIAAVVLVAGAVCAVLAWRSRLGRTSVVLLAATSAVLLAGPSFFAHYIAYTGPWTALVAGVGAGELLGRLRRPALVVGGTVLLAAVVAVPTLPKTFAPAHPAPSLERIAAAAQRVEGCVRSDDPGLLAALGVLSRDLARGCTVWPDVTGWTLDRPGFPATAEQRPRSAAWQRFVSGYLLGGDAVIVNREGTGLSRATRDRIADLPVLARTEDLVLRATR